MTRLPAPPPRRRIPGLSPERRRPTSTPERLRGMVREHEEEEKSFDPEQRGTWRGGSRHERLVVNPSQFHKELRELVDASKLSDPDEAFEKAKAILEEGGNPNDVMDALNELLDMHGVEAFPSQKLSGPDFLYLNSGDTYNATLVYSYDDNKYFVSTFGDIVENAEPEMEGEEWDSWLEGQVRKDLAREIEGQSSLSEEATEKIVEGLDDIESEDLHRQFVEAVYEVGGQVTFENDGSVFVYQQKEAIVALASEILDSAGKVPEQETFGFNPRRRNAGGAMTAEEFMALVKSEADVRDRGLRMSFSPRSGQLFVNYYNLPEDIIARREGGGAEAENNRFMFVVAGFSEGRTGAGQGVPIAATKVKLEHTINSGNHAYRLRGKTGSPEQVARYLAAFLTKIATEVEPRYTHTREPNARRRKVTYRVRGTADDHRDRGMVFGRSSRTLTGEFDTEPEAMREAERFMRSEAPAGRDAKVWIEKSWPDGDFSVLGKWVGDGGRWVPAR